ncbi:hypothetical protein [Streptomyces sp. NPDC091215]|uniref:hypothetical protein n=1 Tax=Streptomyces sp. NPDC091215 TaxID=3155192 RepID=UPI00343BDD1A
MPSINITRESGRRALPSGSNPPQVARQAVPEEDWAVITALLVAAGAAGAVPGGDEGH